MIIIVVINTGCLHNGDLSFQQGKELYKSYCVACHAVNGSGALYNKSVLNNDAFVLGDPKDVIDVILYGREGEGTMPGWRMTLNDEEVAALATYIRQDWSNRAGPVTPAMVTEIRRKREKDFSINPLQ